jgi:FkbM family methyltransferase
MFLDDIFFSLPQNTKNFLRKVSFALQKPQLKKLYSKFVKKDDLVFDVGANIGEHTEVFLELGARVVCIDPQPYCVEVLNNKFAENDSVKIVAQGLSDKPGQLPFHLSTRTHATSSFSDKWKRDGPYNNRVWDKTIKVPVTTLDNLIGEFGKPKYCKIDVEGYEENVLKGLHSAIEYISFEFSRQFLSDARRCLDHIKTLGSLRLNYTINPIMIFASKNWFYHPEKLLLNTKEKKFLITGDIFAHTI